VNGKLENKVAVVTGGSAGIGFGAAKRFADEGARVFITGRRQSELDNAVAAIEGNVTAIQGDVSNLAMRARRRSGLSPAVGSMISKVAASESMY
jgi:NAD(P)-dependent dehydrogenase (short-subunit alcohol dehydrogenase family)